MNVLDFEQWVWQHEKVKIFVRADPSTNIQLDHPDNPMFSSTNTIKQFKSLRLAPMLGNIRYIILLPNMKEASDEMKLMDVRKGYRDAGMV